MISIYQTKEKKSFIRTFRLFLNTIFSSSVSVDENSDRHEGDIDD